MCDNAIIEDKSFGLLQQEERELVRRSFPTAPMFGINAFEARSGNALSAQIAAIIATGQQRASRLDRRDAPLHSRCPGYYAQSDFPNRREVTRRPACRTKAGEATRPPALSPQARQ